jgi:hypothetical protein
MGYTIRAGKNAPSEVVSPSGRVIFEGTYTACLRYIADLEV